MSSRQKLFRMVLAAMFLALALLLPFLTGQIPQIGNALCPMHIPVLLCGFFCGSWYAMAIGLISPLLRFVLFGMPPLVPTGIAMCFELAAYGFVSGYLYEKLPGRKIFIYVALIAAMLSGRVVWAAARMVLYGIAGSEFGWKLFMSGAFLNAIPGIIVHIALIPLIVMVLEKYTQKYMQK